MKACLRICSELCRKCIPFILEHPRTSNIWLLPEVVKLMATPGFAIVDLDQCQFGTKWRKATRLLLYRIDPFNVERLRKRCHRDRCGNCSKTGKPHLQLRGTNEKGQSLTALAGAYPSKLADDIAFCLVDEVIATWGFNTDHKAGLDSPVCAGT